MCKNILKITGKQRTGYKLVLFDEQNQMFISSFTGQVYSFGKLPPVENTLTSLVRGYWENLDGIYSIPYVGEMVGKTAVFEKKESIYNSLMRMYQEFLYPEHRKDLKPVLTLATVSGDLHKAQYRSAKVYLGTRIRFQKILEEL